MEDFNYSSLIMLAAMFVKYIYVINCTHYDTFICSCWLWITLNLATYKLLGGPHSLNYTTLNVYICLSYIIV